LPVVHRDRRVGRRRLGQVEVASKTNEIPLFPVLCDRLDDLRDAVITADALHAQRGHADYLVLQRGAHYLLTVKGNQPSLLTQTTPQK
jgi:predicted transposase YbfD/YdcC